MAALNSCSDRVDAGELRFHLLEQRDGDDRPVEDERIERADLALLFRRQARG
jgi:hypothetical protein